MKKIAMTCAILATLAAGPASSQEWLSQGWYAGVSYGATRGKVDESRINAELTDNLGFISASTSSDTRHSGARVFAGLKLTPWLDIEAYYARLGDTKFTSDVSPPGTLQVVVAAKAYGLAALAGYSPTPGLKLYCKAGVARLESKATPTGTGFVDVNDSLSKRRTSAVYGIGILYQVTRNVVARAEYDVHTNAGDDAMGGKYDIRTASVGVLYGF